MYLLNIETKNLQFFKTVQDAPEYAIASHRWTENEASFQEVMVKKNRNTAGYRKVEKLCSIVRERTTYEWIWIDTCCIDKSDPNPKELETAIRSMFDWYQKAGTCFAYLADVSTSRCGDLKEQFSTSEWFSRGWTLQELLAPQIVAFITEDLGYMGYKGPIHHSPGSCLNSLIRDITGIPKDVLASWDNNHNYSDNTKWIWTEGRETTEEEDKWYCLQGIFDVQMTTRYGETGERARCRLREKIRKDRQRKKEKERQRRNPSSRFSTLSIATQHSLAQIRSVSAVEELLGAEKQAVIDERLAESVEEDAKSHSDSDTDDSWQSSAATTLAEDRMGWERGRKWARADDDSKRSSARSMISECSARSGLGGQEEYQVRNFSDRRRSSVGSMISEYSAGSDLGRREEYQVRKSSDERRSSVGSTRSIASARIQWAEASSRRMRGRERYQSWDAEDTRRSSVEGMRRSRHRSTISRSPGLKTWADRSHLPLKAQPGSVRRTGRDDNDLFQLSETDAIGDKASSASSADMTDSNSDEWQSGDESDESDDSDDSDSDDSSKNFSFFHRLRGKVMLRRKPRIFQSGRY